MLNLCNNLLFFGEQKFGFFESKLFLMCWILEPYQEVTHTYPNFSIERELKFEFEFRFKNQNQIGSTIIKIFFKIKFLAKETHNDRG